MSVTTTPTTSTVHIKQSMEVIPPYVLLIGGVIVAAGLLAFTASMVFFHLWVSAFTFQYLWLPFSIPCTRPSVDKREIGWNARSKRYKFVNSIMWFQRYGAKFQEFDTFFLGQKIGRKFFSFCVSLNHYWLMSVLIPFWHVTLTFIVIASASKH